MYWRFNSNLCGITTSTYVFSGCSDFAKRSFSSKYSRLARSVIPGFTNKTLRWVSLYKSTYLRTSGLGPTRLMCPRKTLINCGNSSILYFLIKTPERVTRGSLPPMVSKPALSLPMRMLLNLNKLKSLPNCPTLNCR